MHRAAPKNCFRTGSVLTLFRLKMAPPKCLCGKDRAELSPTLRNPWRHNGGRKWQWWHGLAYWNLCEDPPAEDRSARGPLRQRTAPAEDHSGRGPLRQRTAPAEDRYGRGPLRRRTLWLKTDGEDGDDGLLHHRSIFRGCALNALPFK